MLPAIFWIAFAAPLIAIAWAVAYRFGLADGRETIPLRLIEEIALHGLLCRGERAADVSRRLEFDLGLRRAEAQRIVAALERRRPPQPARRAS